MANRSFAAVILNGRPPFLPRARADANPAIVRSEMGFGEQWNQKPT